MPLPRSKPTTLADIARVAGVHRKTAGAALQGTGRIASATREKVRRIADELQYEPNLVARALVTGRTGRISILIASLSEPYNVVVVQNLVRSLTKNGYEAVIIQAHDYMPSAQTLRSSFSDGMIIVGMDFVNRVAGMSETKEKRCDEPILPYVVIDARRPAHMDHITVDIGPAVEEALRSMLASGRSRIAYVNRHILEPDYQEVRYQTYMSLMSEAGYEPEIIVADERLTNEERIEQLKAYFQEHGIPSAIFCHNDQLAVFTYRAIRDLGHDIPRETLLVGCDGVDYTNYFDTPLSTIITPWEEVGEMACQFLKQRIDDPSISVLEHIVKGKLVARKSSEWEV